MCHTAFSSTPMWHNILVEETDLDQCFSTRVQKKTFGSLHNEIVNWGSIIEFKGHPKIFRSVCMYCLKQLGFFNVLHNSPYKSYCVNNKI